MKSEQQTISTKGAVITLLVLLAVTIVFLALLALNPMKKVSTFDECIAAGGARLESYPEQCMYKKNTYVNEAQRPIGNESTYVGMTEEEALAEAKKANVPARVVERDGEMLPVTMDFAFGRKNFHVKDGKVYKVDTEGEAEDSN